MRDRCPSVLMSVHVMAPGAPTQASVGGSPLNRTGPLNGWQAETATARHTITTDRIIAWAWRRVRSQRSRDIKIASFKTTRPGRSLIRRHTTGIDEAQNKEER